MRGDFKGAGIFKYIHESLDLNIKPIRKNSDIKWFNWYNNTFQFLLISQTIFFTRNAKINFLFIKGFVFCYQWWKLILWIFIRMLLFLINPLWSDYNCKIYWQIDLNCDWILWKALLKMNNEKWFFATILRLCFSGSTANKIDLNYLLCYSESIIYKSVDMRKMLHNKRFQ